ARRSKKRCFEGNINDIHSKSSSRQRVEFDVERTLAEHSLARGVDYSRRAFQNFVPLFPGQRFYRTGEIFHDLLRALECAIEEPDLFCALLGKSVANGPRAAAGADHDGGPSVSAPTGLLLFDALDETVTIIICACERSVRIDYYTTDSADAL